MKQHTPSRKPQADQPWYRRRSRLLGVGALVLVGLAFLLEHWGHVAPWLPWAILLACPLMHVFMHHGHGAHGGGVSRDASGRHSPDDPADPEAGGKAP